ncbi:MAG: SEL1-like repeat protein [Ectothiorhodospiraceae bacterium]|nr:SEL1-like repeat protein [Ectothiorhodospiraceae bacterium]
MTVHAPMRRMPRLAVLLWLALTPWTTAVADFADGVRAYRAGRVEEAIRILREVGDRGDVRAQLVLGALYGAGEGVALDEAEAVRWYRRAADGGSAEAQLEMGARHALGQGVARDAAEAARWYLRAADGGLADAQAEVAARYDRGDGLPVDPAQALRWYQAAAASGHPQAMANLGAKYADGDGVERDDVRALAWLDLAAGAGVTVAAENLVRLRARMAPTQLEAARALALELRGAASPDVEKARGAEPVERMVPVAGEALTRNEVRELQRRLERLGFSPGPADGVAGRRTRAAIRAYETRVGRPRTGKPSRDLLEDLRARP